MKINIDFFPLWCITTFVTFLVRYFPERPDIDIEFVLKVAGWGLLGAVGITLVILIGIAIFSK